MLTFKIKLAKLLKNESLARARKRIRNGLKQSNLALVYRNVFKDGTEGYKRERIIYDN
jgi:hypothetical protein